MLSNGKWDIRCPKSLKNLFPVRRGYYFKVDNKQALKVLKILSRAYKIKCPVIKRIKAGTNANAMYESPNKVILWSRNHLKSVWHEFYHHLDYCTKGKYNSDDRRGGPSSLAWQFADHMWQAFTSKS